MSRVDCGLANQDRSIVTPSGEGKNCPASGGRARGFTLIELLVVIALIALIATIVSPSIGRGLSVVKLRAGGREIAAALRVARSKAVREQQIYYIGFDRESKEVELASADAHFQKAFVLPEGIFFKEISTGDGQLTDEEKTYCYFLPNGNTQSFSIRIANERGRELIIAQDSLFNSLRIEELQADVEAGQLTN